MLWSLRKSPVELTAATISEAYAAGARAYEENVAAKSEMDALNVEIYKGEDAELMKLWADARKVTVDAFNAIYKSLDISFDRFFYESEVMQLGMEKVEEGKAKGILLESENAVIYPGNEEKHFPPLVFVTSRGTPTYEAKDLGLAVLKDKEFSNAEWYILTAAEQIGHFQVVKAVLGEIDGALGARLNHVPHGMLLLPEGKMSSRTGNVLTAEKLIELTNAKASEKSEDAEVAEQVGVGALKYVVLRSKPGSNVVFDLAQALSHEGDSGPYLQYSLARANSILSKAKDEGIHPSAAILPESVIELERVLYRFPEVAERAAREFEPHYVTTYLTELSGLFNSWYATGKIIDAADPHSPYKLLITEAFATTMKNGLQLLGISTPERM